MMRNRIMLIALTLILLSSTVHINANGHEGFIVKVNVSQQNLRINITGSIEEIGQNKGVYFAETQNDIERLKSLGKIEYIEPNYEVTLFGSPSDEYYSEQINLNLIKSESAWNLGCYGNDVKIGVIDSGINNHPDLYGNILPGYNYRDENEDVSDTNGHGTFVCGLIAANRNDIGIVGVAHKAKIIPLKSFGIGTNTSLKTIVDAIYGAVDDFDCQIINMSFGLTSNAASLADAVNYAVSKGVIIVAAVGNDGNDTLYYPAGYKNVIGVGSVDNDKNISNFSQRNTSVFVTAPGNAVKSLGINGDYNTNSGTSFSAPLVTGAIAIAKCIDEYIDTDEVMELLMESSEDLGDLGYDVYYGQGLLNIQLFIDKMLEDVDWYVSPIDKDEKKYTVFIYNNSGVNDAVTSVFAGYIDSKLIKTNVVNIILHTGESVSMDFEHNETYAKHFLWSDMASMTPLYKVRRTD